MEADVKAFLLRSGDFVAFLDNLGHALEEVKEHYSSLQSKSFVSNDTAIHLGRRESSPARLGSSHMPSASPAPPRPSHVLSHLRRFQISLSMLQTAEEALISSMQRSIEQAPPLLLAKNCYDEVGARSIIFNQEPNSQALSCIQIQQLRVMSTFLAPDRPRRALRDLTERLEAGPYGSQAEGCVDVFLQFPMIRLREYFDFFSSLQLISPENHPDYFPRVQLIEELKRQLNDVQRKLNGLNAFSYLEELFYQRLEDGPVCRCFGAETLHGDHGRDTDRVIWVGMGVGSLCGSQSSCVLGKCHAVL